MARVTVQAGHMEPRGERPGYAWGKPFTGTFREIEFNTLLGREMVAQFAAAGHEAVLIGADGPAPGGDVFISLHADSGNARVAARGQSSLRWAIVGYPATTDLAPPAVLSASKALAIAWKDEHARIYPGRRWGPDNMTVGLRRYYMWKASADRAGGGRYKAAYLAEHGVLTNAEDEAWLFANIDSLAASHVAAVGRYYPATKRPSKRPSKPKVARLLKVGTSGSDVREWQAALRDKAGIMVFSDGVFGTATSKATRTFQRRAGVDIDGIVGPATRAKMAAWEMSPAVSAIPIPAGRPLLRRWGLGRFLHRSHVRAAQRILFRSGIDIRADGLFGAGTHGAVVEFQRTRGLAADGMVGRRTWAALSDLAAGSA